MPPTPLCPEPHELERFTLGHVPEPETESLGRHLLSCSHCADTLNNLHAHDTLTEALRGSRDTQPVDLPFVEDLMDRLARTPPTWNRHDTAAFQDEDEALPGQIGRYQVLGCLGAGGMGTVYRAHDAQLRRDVAIKVPRFNGTTEVIDAARQRFLREVRAAAAVRNAHVCPIYDVSELDGRPHVVMALVDGGSLAERLRKGPFADCRAAVTLVGQVADALAAVHAAGIVHRDLKPGNILLDRSGQALLTDFGLARDESDSEHLTAQGTLLGTPAYMAPEQVEPEFGPVGPWSDQYSLAVVLYEMLTGRRPFEGSILSLIHQIATKTPPPPSQYRPGLDAELERLLLTALARRPKDRYPNVAQFQRALFVWRERQPVVGPPALPVARAAAPPPLPEVTAILPARTAPQPRRRRPWWPVAAAALVLLVGGLLALQIIIRIQAEDGKVTEVKVPGKPITVEIIDHNGKKILLSWEDGKLKVKPVKEKVELLKTGQPLGPLALVGQPAKIEGGGSWTVDTIGHRGTVTACAYRPDSKQMASAGTDGTIRLWDETGRLVRLMFRHEPENGSGFGVPTLLVWSPDGSMIACRDWTGNTALFKTQTGKSSFLEKPQDYRALAWSPDGKLLAGVDADGVVSVRILSTDEFLPLDIRKGATGVIFSLDGKQLIAGGAKDLKVWNLETGNITQTLAEEPGPGGYGPCLAWSPNGKTLLAGMRLWDFGAKASRPLAHSDGASSSAWSPDGKKVYYYNGSGQVVSYDSISGEYLGAFQFATRYAGAVSIAPDGGTCFGETTGFGASLKCVDLATQKPRFEIVGHGLLWSAFSPDRKTLATAQMDSTLQLWDVAKGSRTRLAEHALLNLDARPNGLIWSADGKELFYDVILDGTSLRPFKKDEHALAAIQVNCTHRVAWSPDGKKFAVAYNNKGPDDRLHILETATGKSIQRLKLDMRIDRLAWSPDGTQLVAAGYGWAALILKVDTKDNPIRTEVGSRSEQSVAYHPDGKLVAFGGDGLYLCQASTGKLLHTFTKNTYVPSIAFTADGKRVAALADGGLQVWDVESRKLWKHHRPVAPSNGRGPDGTVTWMPDSKTVAVSDLASVVTFIDAADGTLRGTFVCLSNERGLAINGEGHYRGTENIENAIVYVVQTAKGQDTLTPAEFAKRFGWTNKPERVRLSAP